MSKTLFFVAAALGGMAFFTMISRYGLFPGATRTDTAGGGCSKNACGPREGEVLKGEEELTASDEQWRKKLTPQQFNVTRRKGTEPAFSGDYWDCHKSGVYRCVCCGTPLFSSQAKFDSGTGWPSFWEPIDRKSVGESPTIATAYSGWRSCATSARPIWATSSTTARSRPACATASIRPP